VNRARQGTEKGQKTTVVRKLLGGHPNVEDGREICEKQQSADHLAVLGELDTESEKWNFRI